MSVPKLPPALIPAKTQLRPRGQVMKRKPHTVRRGAGHGHESLPGRVTTSGSSVVTRWPQPGNRPARGDDEATTEAGRRLLQGGQARCVPAVVVGQNQRRLGVATDPIIRGIAMSSEKGLVVHS